MFHAGIDLEVLIVLCWVLKYSALYTSTVKFEGVLRSSGGIPFPHRPPPETFPRRRWNNWISTHNSLHQHTHTHTHTHRKLLLSCPSSLLSQTQHNKSTCLHHLHRDVHPVIGCPYHSSNSLNSSTASRTQVYQQYPLFLQPLLWRVPSFSCSNLSITDSGDIAST